MTFAKQEDKGQILREHLSSEGYIMVHLNPKMSGVIVPSQFKNDDTLTLKLSYNFAGRVEVTAETVKAQLSFSGQMFDCEIPLNAIWGCTTELQKNYIWPESLSANSFSALASEIQSIKKPQLAVKKAEKTDPLKDSKQEIEKPKTNTNRPTLKRIK